MLKKLKQLELFMRNRRLSKLDTRVYIYLYLNNRKNKILTPYNVAGELGVSTQSVVQSYQRLIETGLIIEKSKVKVRQHWVYDFEFGA